MESDPAMGAAGAGHVTLMACHKIRRDESRLRRQLANLQQLMASGVHAGAIASHKSTFDLMLGEVRALQATLEGQIRNARGFTAIPEESRHFIETTRSVLDDTAALVELLTRLGAE